MRRWVFALCALVSCRSEAAPDRRPLSQGWRPITAENAPSPDGYTMGEWVGGKLASYGPGGSGVYDAQTDRWARPASTPHLFDHEPYRPLKASIVAGDSIVVLYDNLGYAPDMFDLTAAAYVLDLKTAAWRTLPLSGVAAPARAGYAAAWTGKELVVWGGEAMPAGFKPEPRAVHRGGANRGDEPEPKVVRPRLLATGFALDPTTLAIRAIAKSPLSARSEAAAVWTGTRMFVWGGLDSPYALHERETSLRGGALYDPATDRWTPVSTEHAPAARPFPMLEMAGGRVVLFGGTGANDGGIYDPATDHWDPIPAPPGITNAHGVIEDGSLVVQDGEHAAAFDLATRTWSDVPAPQAHLVYTRAGMIGDMQHFTQGPYTVGRYVAREHRWHTRTLPPLELPAGAVPRAAHYDGARMIVWGLSVPTKDHAGTSIVGTGNAVAKGWIIDAAVP